MRNSLSKTKDSDVALALVALGECLIPPNNGSLRKVGVECMHRQEKEQSGVDLSRLPWVLSAFVQLVRPMWLQLMYDGEGGLQSELNKFKGRALALSPSPSSTQPGTWVAERQPLRPCAVAARVYRQHVKDLLETAIQQGCHLRGKSPDALAAAAGEVAGKLLGSGKDFATFLTSEELIRLDWLEGCKRRAEEAADSAAASLASESGSSFGAKSNSELRSNSASLVGAFGLPVGWALLELTAEEASRIVEGEAATLQDDVFSEGLKRSHRSELCGGDSRTAKASSTKEASCRVEDSRGRLCSCPAQRAKAKASATPWPNKDCFCSGAAAHVSGVVRLGKWRLLLGLLVEGLHAPSHRNSVKDRRSRPSQQVRGKGQSDEESGIASLKQTLPGSVRVYAQHASGPARPPA